MRHHTFFSFLLVLVSFNYALAQDSLWSVSLMGSVNHTYFEPSGTMVFSYGGRSPDVTGAFTEGSSGWSTGVLVARKLSRRWEVETGMMYSEYRYLYEGELPDPMFNYHSTSFQRGEGGGQYLSFPLMLKYYLHKDKNAYYLTSGIMAEHEPGYQGFHLDFAHRMGVGSLLHLFGDYSLRVEPAFQYALTPYLEFSHEFGGYQFRPSVLSLQIGIRKEF